MTITIRYGINTITRGYCSQPTVGDLQRDNVLKAALGFGDNTRVLMNGVQLPSETPLQEGATVSIETAANTKAGTITIRIHVLLAEGTIEERLHARTQEKTRTNSLAESLNPPLRGEKGEESAGVAETILETRFPIPESDLDEHNAETTIWPMLLLSLREDGQLGRRA